METRNLIELVDVHKTYYPPSGAVAVLKGAGLSLERGRSAAVTGPSGSGKTTLLNLIAALDIPESGRVMFDGTDISSYDSRALARFRMKHVGIVFQQHFLLPQCTVLENVLLPTLPMKTPPDKALKRAGDLLDQVGLSARRDFFPARLSGGECQRVAIARALINDPELILADEPTGSLDRENALAIIELLEKTSQSDKTLIIVTHAGFIAERMQERFCLSDGRLVRQGESDGLQ